MPGLHNINTERDGAELILTRMAYHRQKPMLGICRGIQTLAMALGGHVDQDIIQQIKHSQDADRSEPTHSVSVEPGSFLYSIYAPKKDNKVAPAAGEIINNPQNPAPIAKAPRYRPSTTSRSRTGAVSSNSSRPLARSSATSRIVIAHRVFQILPDPEANQFPVAHLPKKNKLLLKGFPGIQPLGYPSLSGNARRIDKIGIQRRSILHFQAFHPFQ